MYGGPISFRTYTIYFEIRGCTCTAQQHGRNENTLGLTLLCDGWEDAAGRSIYATVAAEVAKPPSCRFCWLSWIPWSQSCRLLCWASTSLCIGICPSLRCAPKTRWISTICSAVVQQSFSCNEYGPPFFLSILPPNVPASFYPPSSAFMNNWWCLQDSVSNCEETELRDRWSRSPQGLGRVPKWHQTIWRYTNKCVGTRLVEEHAD